MKDAMFVAFVTEKNDGHKYISVAASKGAVAAIVSADIDAVIPAIKVKDTVKAYQDIAKYHRSKFSIPVIGLTGSNGKTTVKDMLTAVLSAKYKVLATDKNLNNHLGVPQTLLKLNDTHEVAVIEMGMNHHGEIRTLTNISMPDIAIITKIGTAHMGNLGGTRADVYRAKMEIVEGLKKGGKLVLNSNDDMLVQVTSEIHDVIFCGLEDKEYNLLFASDVSQTWDNDGYGLSFLVHFDGNEYNCTLPILGRHNVQNALLALTVGVQLGVPMEDAIEALQIYPRSSMRLETSSVYGIKFIKDYYNASPESMKAALNTLAEINTAKSRIAILGELFELGEQSKALHREMAEYTIGKADKVYYVGNHCDAFAFGRSDAHCFQTKEEMNDALSSAILNGNFSAGDMVLIKGSNGMKMWEQFEFLRRLLERGSIVSAQTRMLVDVDALKHNYTAIKRYVGNNVLVMPVIKADAYGSGADVAANIYGDCKYIAVADLREAEELHAVMPNAKFLVIYQPLIPEVDWAMARDYIILSIGDKAFVRGLNESAKKHGKEVTVHIEVDTGMSRLGVVVNDCKEFAETLSECKNIVVEGIFTHYSCADRYTPHDLAFTEKQTFRFKQAIETFENIIGHIPYKHACASAAIFNPKAELFDMVRPGYMLFGYYPCDEIKDKITLKPALKYAAQVTQIKECEAGVEVSYGRNFVTQRKTRLAEIPVGYSDGLMRRLSNKGAFVINGQLAPIVGTVCMDYTMVDVTDINPIVRACDDVYIFDNDNMTIERMAELCDTIGYEIITNIKNKADRIETF
jgi:alanine racemase